MGWTFGWIPQSHLKIGFKRQQISCETAAYVQSLLDPTHNFEVAILKLELTLCTLK